MSAQAESTTTTTAAAAAAQMAVFNTSVAYNAAAVLVPEIKEDKYKDFYENSQFITGMVLYPIIIILGLVGNSLSLIVLSRKKMINSTNTFLMALAVADMIKLMNDALYTINVILDKYDPPAANHMMGLLYPFSHYIFNEAVCVTAWLTVSVAVERYISVCHPTRAVYICTVYKAKLISAFVFVFMSLLAIPSAFRYTSVLTFDPQTNVTLYAVEPSALGRNTAVMRVYSLIQNLSRSVIPLFVLVILNSLIIHALRRQQAKFGRKYCARNRITWMLIIVIIVFLVCITPDAIMSMCFGYGYVDEDNLVKGIREFTDMLLAVNSAANFVVYCAFNSMFRETFKQVFCPTLSQKDYLKTVDGSNVNHLLLPQANAVTTSASRNTLDTSMMMQTSSNGSTHVFVQDESL